jgi:hypothetical protein
MKKKISVQTETDRNKICFAFVSVCFVKQKKIFFGLFRCFEPVSKQPKQTELFRNEPRQSGIFWKLPKYALFQSFQNLAEQKEFSLKKDIDKKKKSPKTLYCISYCSWRCRLLNKYNSFLKEYWNKNKYSPKNALFLNVAEVKVLNK